MTITTLPSTYSGSPGLISVNIGSCFTWAALAISIPRSYVSPRMGKAWEGSADVVPAEPSTCTFHGNCDVTSRLSRAVAPGGLRRYGQV